MNIEESIITVFLKNPKLVLENDISPSDFENILLAEALQVIKSLAISEIEVDVIVVAEKMKSPGALSVLVDLFRNGSGVKANIKHYIKSVKEGRLKQKLHNLLGDAIEGISHSSIDETIGSLTTSLSSLRNKDVDHAYNSKEMMRKTLDHIEDMYELKFTAAQAA